MMLAEEELNPWLKRAEASGVRVRITCRATDWPRSLSDQFERYYLRELSPQDVHSAAERAGLDATDFVRRVEDAGGGSLARMPLTLKMLLKLAAGTSPLPRSRKDLFEKAVLALATEAEERYEAETNRELSPAELVKAAEYLSCYMALNGRFVVDLSEDPHPESLGRQELDGLSEASPRLKYSVLRMISSSGLCEADGENSFGFLHRQIPEYLAGRRVGQLLLHQARSLLAHPEGWRMGVAGPLRGTAAFAAAENMELARWIAEHDPEVIGRSDVSNQELRRFAVDRLIKRFRSGELTGSQLYRGKLSDSPIEFRGLLYEGAERDLRSLIETRRTEPDDVLHLLAVMIEDWGLNSMSEELADMVMDSDLSIQVRKSAGYALKHIGSESARRRLKPLIHGAPEDESDDLKGLALHCNWPENMTVAELFAALAVPKRASYIGAYESFLYEVSQSEFDFGENPLEALERIERFLSVGGSVHLKDLVVRVLESILKRLNNWEIAVRAARVLLREDDQFRDDELQGLAPTVTSSRRLLISALARESGQRYRLGALAEEIDGLLKVEDFEWLLEQAADSDLNLEKRENYVELAGTLTWEADSDCIRAWDRFRDVEPIRSKLRRSTKRNIAESVQLWAEGARWRTQRKLRRLWRNRRRLTAPRPEQEVNVVLKKTHKRPEAFGDLCWAMSVVRRGDSPVFTRFLTETPIWKRANPRMRRKIVRAAKRYLTASDIAERCREIPLKRVLPGMAAVWLLVEVEPEWLEQQSQSWWDRWCWFLLREFHPRNTEEPEEPKTRLVSIFHEVASDHVRRELCRLAANEEPSAEESMGALLEVFAPNGDLELEEALSLMLEERTVAAQTVQAVARFLLAQGSPRAIEVCRSELETYQREEVDEQREVGCVVAVLLEQPVPLWEQVMAAMRRDEEIGRKVIEEVARTWSFRSNGKTLPNGSLTVAAKGELLELLFRNYPPDSDPSSEGVRSFGGDDYAREWRDRLLSELRDSGGAEEVEVVRRLEARLGDRYPWLRKTLAQAIRKYKLALWQPLPLDVIDEILSAKDRRLLRSGEDVVEGIVTALEVYENSLRTDGPHAVGDLWNAAKDQAPSPKDEEQISQKICGFIRGYFREYGVASNREVEIRRRSLPRTAGGESGSELDVLVDVPARGNLTGTPIRVPIEVKLSSNNEVKTAMRHQLVDRYIGELGASDGVYAVVWMDIPERSQLKPGHRPRWSDLDTGKTELHQQATQLSGDGLNLQAVVVDASLR